MDIKCATCQEPWDTHHMLEDEVWEVWDGEEDSSSHLLIKKFLEGPKTSIPAMLREDLKDKGWVFGRTVVCILECACCGSNAGDAEDTELVKMRKELRILAEELMGNDLGGIISSMASADHFAEVV